MFQAGGDKDKKKDKTNKDKEKNNKKKSKGLLCIYLLSRLFVCNIFFVTTVTTYAIFHTIPIISDFLMIMTKT